MLNRNFEVARRDYNKRDPKLTGIVREFTLQEIKQHFDMSIEDIRDQFEVAEHLMKLGRTDQAENIWRSQIVFAESVLDFYIHEISKYAFRNIFNGIWPVGSAGNFKFTLSMLLDCMNAENPEEVFLNHANTTLSKNVYLSPQNMDRQLESIGLDLDPILKDKFGSVAKGRDILDKMYKRRNSIAHQMDRNHASGEQAEINREQVEEVIKSAEMIVEGIQEEVLKK